MSYPPKLNPVKKRLLDRIHAMPVPGALDLTDAEWIPSIPWLRKVPLAKLSIRAEHNKFFIFRIG